MSAKTPNPAEEIALNQYIDNLQRNAQAALPDGIDRDTANFARLLVAAENGSSMLDEATRLRIWQQTMGATSELHSRQNDVKVGFLHYRRFTLRFAAALIFIVALSFAMFGPRPASAAEIVSRASQTASDPASAGITSYRSVVSYTSYAFNIQTNTMIPGLAYQSQMLEWYRTPHFRRDEVYTLREMDTRSPVIPMPVIAASSLKPASLDGSPASSVQPRLARVYGADANQSWDYDVARRVITLEDIVSYDGQTNPFGGSSLSSMLLNAAQDYDNVRLLGNDTVAGRAVYLIEVTTKPGNAVLLGEKTVYKIDQQNFLTLGETTTDGKGNIITSSQFLDIQFNPVLEDSLFTLTTPQDTTVVDLHTLPILSPSELAQRWHDVAARNAFPVYAPTFFPNGAIAGRPAASVYNENTIEQHYRIKDDPWAIQFSEANFDFSPRDLGAPIQVGAYQGYYDDQHGALELRLHIIENGDTKQSGTYVVFRCQPQSASKADLIRMAESLQRIVIPTSVF